MKNSENNGMMTFGGHLEVLRQMIFRILGVSSLFAIIVFCFKDTTWNILLAPSEWNFVSYTFTEHIMHMLGLHNFHFDEFHVKLIATDLSSQFMTHLSTSIYLGLLISSPYILYELFHFVSPALFENERKYSAKVICAVYFLFIIGILISYYMLFPISFRFLGTYSVSNRIESTITLDSYVSTFITMTLLMGVVFQLPVISFVLGKMGIINATILSKYRKHAFIIILTIAAIITPGQDILSLILVTLPLYLLYEISIKVVKKAC
ncbi:twin-arginine translocase subunit TatC [Xylanibacter rarus]|uniref:Sec-independent protein translocase protein TatC n=1 Tax=Xylanibacter rarus TaxID=1676614 RepID=A0A8E1QXJ1_9BACT|nr:twin-arginine translocase subunit TatC [Xylanibacter rarus]KOO68596.1 preprotein translocase [Xylanibacter rarus]